MEIEIRIFFIRLNDVRNGHRFLLQVYYQRIFIDVNRNYIEKTSKLRNTFNGEIYLSYAYHFERSSRLLVQNLYYLV